MGEEKTCERTWAQYVCGGEESEVYSGRNLLSIWRLELAMPIQVAEVMRLQGKTRRVRRRGLWAKQGWGGFRQWGQEKPWTSTKERESTRGGNEGARIR